MNLYSVNQIRRAKNSPIWDRVFREQIRLLNLVQNNQLNSQIFNPQSIWVKAEENTVSFVLLVLKCAKMEGISPVQWLEQHEEILRHRIK
ncbi:hypothetical protein [Acidiphilium sp. JA12-A1]|uniref:hypothetical protein n=1 Tax=Acidiphilium sp. JA12-A1 TaxID=1464546 RepID=UPI00128EC09F|nr:hypothetical protein [Acidiphilium sp. JA12-A1]